MIEICLILLGAVTVVASFMIGEKFSPTREFAKEKVAEVLETQIKNAETRFHDAARQLSEDMQEATERELEKICNEKIIALHEDSDTTFGDIEKNHQEVVFLYSMLDDKRKELEALTISLRSETKETRELVQDLMLSKDITQMLEQEITLGRDIISEFKQLRDGADVVLALAEESIDVLDEKLVDFQQLDEKLAELQQLDEKLAELRQLEEKLAGFQELDEKLVDLQQLEARISLRQKEEREREEAAKKAEQIAERRAAVRKKAMEADSVAAEKAAVKKAAEVKAASSEAEADVAKTAEKMPEIKEIASVKSGIIEIEETEEPAPRRTALRRRKTEEKEAVLASARAAMKKKENEPEEEGNFNQRILRMHRDGMTETEIAKSLSLGVGEVRLVIGLFEGAKV